MRKERRLRVSEKRVLKRIFGPKRYVVRREWRKLNNKKFNDLYSTPNIKKIEMGGACSTYGERRVLYRVFVRKPEGKRPLGRTRRRWEDNIKMSLQEMG